jgi:hypothetical protein
VAPESVRGINSNARGYLFRANGAILTLGRRGNSSSEIHQR